MRSKELSDSVFEQLAEALNRLPNGFPRTESRVEIRILKKIFLPEQAALACQLSGKFEPVDVIAQRAGLPTGEISRMLFKMVRSGMVWLDKPDGRICFRLAPFVVGVYEAQAELMDHELAHLVEDYFAEGGTLGIMGPQPALQRVVPAVGTVKAEAILPYEDVRAILLSARTFNVIDCICRLQQDKIGSPCKFPVHVCLNFSQNERASRPGDISQAQALFLLEQCEQVGLVHTVSNVMEGVGYVCNCCGCCCGILRGITKFGIEDSVAYANYYAVIDSQFCANCGNCIERCQVGAISEGEGCSVVDRKRCIGCGLCVSGCPNDVARLERKPEVEMVQPPRDFAAWEHERLVNRGLAETG
jgi:NAD-dependent dihydropyrimidine dehydrogenase PreA subunit